jgi:hypothetical protein
MLDGKLSSFHLFFHNFFIIKRVFVLGALLNWFFVVEVQKSFTKIKNKFIKLIL